ncbi:PfkB family carbohydrate kinase [Pseudomonas japonica]|uniref:PfkB family carbohydrate kinase n=1 Tax=Pseudomonas japonica TaxID=256466 RepID=UPI0015E46E53|nr:PfkB family carbohydrate kinase [Pseudomonas japonica]
MPRTLLSLGSINADFQVRLSQAPGSQETLLAEGLQRLSGGKAANTAYLGALFGHRSLLLGRVGADDLADQALGPLRKAGVLLDGVTHATGAGTAVSMIAVPANGKKQIILANEANDAWDEMAQQRVLSAIAEAPSQALLVLDYEVPAHIVRLAVTAAHARAMPVVVDPSFPERLERGLMPQVTALTPNLEEAAALLGHAIHNEADTASAAEALKDLGAQIGVVKMPGGGCLVACAEGVYAVPSSGRPAVDATGAGDAFTGTFAIALLEGQPAVEAALWGSAAANLAVAAFGSQPAYQGREAVMALAQTLRPRIRRLHD